MPAAIHRQLMLRRCRYTAEDSANLAPTAAELFRQRARRPPFCCFGDMLRSADVEDPGNQWYSSSNSSAAYPIRI